jgi:hypothetical protein
VSPREARYEKNQVLFRELNERIVELAETWGGQEIGIVCECATTGCTELIQVPLAVYQRVRQRRDWFLIKPGHVFAGDEQVVEQREGYEIIKVEV